MRDRASLIEEHITWFELLCLHPATRRPPGRRRSRPGLPRTRGFPVAPAPGGRRCVRGWLYTILYNRFLTDEAPSAAPQRSGCAIGSGRDELLGSMAVRIGHRRTVICSLPLRHSRATVGGASDRGRGSFLWRGGGRAGRADRDGDVSPFARPRAAASIRTET